MEGRMVLFSSLLTFMLLVHTTSVPPISIFILAGQSNMAGRGGNYDRGTKWDGVVPLECQPNKKILRFNANLTWEEAREPLHRDIDTNKTCGVGPGMPFSTSLLKRDPEIGVIGLVPCAIGGTSINEWHRGSTNYNRTLVRAYSAELQGGVLRGFLWYQGESDQGSTLYASSLQEFITNIRSDLRSPLLPFIEVALDSTREGAEIVREAQFHTATKLSNVKCVDAKGLKLQGDDTHLTTASQVKLGRMMATAFLAFH